MDASKCDFYKGFAAALGTLARIHDMPSVAVDIMRTNGVTLNDLRKAGVDSFDLNPLKREWRDRPLSQSPKTK